MAEYAAGQQTNRYVEIPSGTFVGVSESEDGVATREKLALYFDHNSINGEGVTKCGDS